MTAHYFHPFVATAAAPFCNMDDASAKARSKTQFIESVVERIAAESRRRSREYFGKVPLAAVLQKQSKSVDNIHPPLPAKRKMRRVSRKFLLQDDNELSPVSGLSFSLVYQLFYFVIESSCPAIVM